jgi:hypothetical protein
MLHPTAWPTSPVRAVQRTGLALVPCMQRRCKPTGSVSASGTVPPGASSASDQWKDTRNVAQQAPQAWQSKGHGPDSGTETGSAGMSRF